MVWLLKNCTNFILMSSLGRGKRKWFLANVWSKWEIGLIRIVHFVFILNEWWNLEVGVGWSAQPMAQILGRGSEIHNQVGSSFLDSNNLLWFFEIGLRVFLKRCLEMAFYNGHWVYMKDWIAKLICTFEWGSLELYYWNNFILAFYYNMCIRIYTLKNVLNQYSKIWR